MTKGIDEDHSLYVVSNYVEQLSGKQAYADSMDKWVWKTYVDLDSEVKIYRLDVQTHPRLGFDVAVTLDSMRLVQSDSHLASQVGPIFLRRLASGLPERPAGTEYQREILNIVP